MFFASATHRKKFLWFICRLLLLRLWPVNIDVQAILLTLQQSWVNIHTFFTGSFKVVWNVFTEKDYGLVFTCDIVVLDWFGARFSSISHPLPRLCRNRQAEAKVSKGGLGEGDFCEGGEGGTARRLPVTLPVSSFKSATNIKQFSHQGLGCSS